MKHLFTQLLFLLAAPLAFAQAPIVKDNSSSGDFSPLIPDDPSYYEQTDHLGGGDIPEGAGDIIFSEDFGNGFPTGWTLLDSSGICPWKYSFTGSTGFFAGNGPVINSTTASNGFLLCDPDSANDVVNGQPSGANYDYLSTYFITDAIPTFGYSNVRIQFQQFYRYNNDVTLRVQVSNVGPNGPFQESYNVRANNAANNTASASAEQVSVDLSSAMGNTNIYIRVGWSSRVYYWQIDDFQVVEVPDNDLSIAQNYYGNHGDSTRTQFYTEIPERQADATAITFGAAVRNAGLNTVTNSGLRVEVNNGGTNVYTGQSSGANQKDIPALSTDSFTLTQTYTPNLGVGDYEVQYIPVSDSVDAFPGNDTLVQEFTVSDNVFARDNGINGGGITWGATANTIFAIGNMFEFAANDTIVAMRINLFDNATSGNGTGVGSAINVKVWDENFNIVGSEDFHVVDTFTTPFNTYADIVFSNPVAVTPGEYVVGFEKFVGSDRVWISTFDFELDDAPPLTSFIDLGIDGTWAYIADIPMIRAITKPASCLTTTFGIVGTVEDDNAVGSVTISNITGGTGTYTFSWTGPNGFSSNQQNITGLIEKGDYTLMVTDGNFCSGSQTFTVDGLVSTGDFILPMPEVRLFPNPNDGAFELLFRNAPRDQYQLRVVNMLGQEIYTQQLVVTGTQKLDLELTDAESGVYFLNITNSDQQSSSHKLIVR